MVFSVAMLMLSPLGNHLREVRARIRGGIECLPTFLPGGADRGCAVGAFNDLPVFLLQVFD